MFDFIEEIIYSTTKREVLFSIVIIAFMLILGFVISDKINDYIEERDAEYNTALILNDDHEAFQYGVRTNIGNVFAYGKLKAVDGVTFDEIGGNFIWVRKIEEKYLPHTRIVSNGKTSHIETYYTWDVVDKQQKNCNIVSFMDVNFNFNQLNMPESQYYSIDYKSPNVRYVYVGCPTSVVGTLYANLSDKTVKNGEFYLNTNIEEVFELLDSSCLLTIFWVVWCVLIIIAVICFYLIENKWLED